MEARKRHKYLNEFSKLATVWLKTDMAKQELSYLNNRFLSNQINYDIFKFGYFPTEQSSIIEFIDQYGKLIDEDPKQILLDCGIIYITEKYNKIVSFFKNNTLLIPFFNMYGDVVSISGRTLHSTEYQKENNISKYKHLAFDKKRHLYGINFTYKNILKKDQIIITEGQFDFISAYISGVDNIVSLGGSKFTFEQIALIKRFTDNIVLFLDNDEAGEKGVEKFKKSQEKYNIKVKEIKIDKKYKDLDEYLKSGIILNI